MHSKGDSNSTLAVDIKKKANGVYRFNGSSCQRGRSKRKKK